MFPWLPFLTFPDSRKRKRKFRVYLPHNDTNTILCSAEILTHIPYNNKENEIKLAPTRLSTRSPSSPVPSTSSKSPRSGSALATSRPSSARDNKRPLFAPPPEPKPSKHQRKGLETSLALRELFGGGGNDNIQQSQPLIQITSSKVEEPSPVKEEVKVEIQDIITSNTEVESKTPQNVADVYKSTGISACFETILHPDLSNKNFARKNVLERETLQQSEWEIVKSNPSTSSTFQVRIINSSSNISANNEEMQEINTDWLAWLLSICFAIYLIDIALRARLYGRRILDNRRS